MSAKAVSRFGMLTAVALVLGWVEQFIPIGGIPGIKLGLANTVLLYAIFLMDTKGSWLLMFLKVVLSGFLFAGLAAMLYSFAGGLLSLIVMLLLHKARGFSIVGVSVAGAVGHNIGQLLIACFMVTPRAALSYFPILLIAGVVTGLLTGVAANSVIQALQTGSKNTRTEEWKTDKDKT